MIKKITKGIKNPRLILLYLMDMKFFRIIPDKAYLKIKYYLKMKKKINFNNPKTFNEKIQWLKLHDRKPEYNELVDKYKVRKHIAETIGEKHLIPLIGVWDNYEDINFDELPNKFVLKPNHTSGNVYICKNKSKIDYKELKEKVNSWLKREYYWYHREWCYKNIKPKILCEKYMVDESGVELKDYKFLCFNGEPKIIQVMSGRKNGKYYINHYDLDWNSVSVSRENIKENNEIINKPKDLQKMIDISRKLSENKPFSRIDLYETVNSIYFGEITFFPVSGYMGFKKEETNYLLGSWIDLPIEKKEAG